MGTRAQKTAIANDRSGLTQPGTVRLELQVFAADRDLIRTLARKLVEDGPDAGPFRRTLQQAVAGEPGILGALRRSPLVGADLDLARGREAGRKAGL